MRTILSSLVLSAVILASCSRTETMEQLTERVFAVASEQSRAMAASLAPEQSPKTFQDGRLITAGPDWWCSGFFPGTLWEIYEYSGEEEFRSLAERETAKVEPMKLVEDHHDVGFQIGCSFGNQYRLTGDSHALEVMRTAAENLTHAFTPEVGCIKSWPFVKEGFQWSYPVIIDNMMNLELLMTVGNIDGNEKLTNVALSHAEKTMQNHFRDDFSCCHLVDYVPETGQVNKKITVQGLADNSAWARGQAWALYGFTMMYDKSGDVRFLHHAQNVADMIVSRLPDDGIPYWDFDSPNIPDEFRDASAAAVMASAFILLDTLADNGKDYLSIAEKQLRTLAGPDYLAAPGENGNFLLKHSVGSIPDESEIDVPLTYADYYFLEALLRYRKSH